MKKDKYNKFQVVGWGGPYQRCVGDMVSKKIRFLWGSTLDATQSAQARTANSMPPSPSISSQTPFVSVFHLQNLWDQQGIRKQFLIASETFFFFHMKLGLSLILTTALRATASTIGTC